MAAMAHVGTSAAGAAHLTAEQDRIIRQNRLRAKERIQQQAAAQFPAVRLAVLGKRKGAGVVRLDGAAGQAAESGSHASLRGPHRGPAAASAQGMMLGPNGNVSTVTPATTRNANLAPEDTRVSPTKPKMASLLAAGAIEDPNAPLPRDKSLGNYIEFDLSKLHNSKGGFLVDEDEGEANSKSLQELRAERERIQERLREGMEPGINLTDETRCAECGSREVDDEVRAIFRKLVCKACQKRHPEKYSLLTKTEVKEDYLLTDSELRDPELLPHLLKANPHKSTYSNMMLYLRCQVEEYAFSPQRWGSEAGLDAEFTRREQEKAQRRETKFVKGLRDLRRKTRDNAWEKRQAARHVCRFEDVADAPGRQRCAECGFEIDVEVL